MNGPDAAADGILVPEHFVPTPTSISPQAQAMLRMKLPVGNHALPAPDDAAAWAEFRQAAEGGMVMLTHHYSELYPADVTTHNLSAAPIHEVTPKNLAPENRDRAIYYIHGGGFIVGGGQAAILPSMQMAGMARCTVYAIDYRMAPQFPFPTPVEDTLEGYRFLLERHEAANIAFFGPSAGANLAPASILKARESGLPMPAACAMHSCPSDNSDPGDSAQVNVMVDIVLRELGSDIADNYARGHDLKDPLLSPLYGDYTKGFPPSILTAGTRDLLLSGTVRMHRALIRAGIKAELHIWEAMTHAPFFGAPEEEELYMQHINFMLQHMDNC